MRQRTPNSAAVPPDDDPQGAFIHDGGDPGATPEAIDLTRLDPARTGDGVPERELAGAAC